MCSAAAAASRDAPASEGRPDHCTQPEMYFREQHDHPLHRLCFHDQQIGPLPTATVALIPSSEDSTTFAPHGTSSASVTAVITRQAYSLLLQ